MGYREDYWLECVSIALEDAGITATKEQVAEEAGAVQGAHECYGMYTGDDVASANWHASNEREKSDLKKAVVFEKEKVNCPACNGAGRLRYNSGPWGVDQHCGRCRGDGRVHPSHLT